MRISTDDFTNLMATQLRTEKVDLTGSIDVVEGRVIAAIVKIPRRLEIGLNWPVIRPRLTEAVEIARELGPIDIHTEPVAA